jgi:hypothetical protein
VRYGFAERCRHGRIPIAGTLVDESAGSSGTPFNWLRSAKELHDVHVNTANWVRYTYPTERLFAINAFSVGAWATGTNVGIALSRAWSSRRVTALRLMDGISPGTGGLRTARPPPAEVAAFSTALRGD